MGRSSTPSEDGRRRLGAVLWVLALAIVGGAIAVHVVDKERAVPPLLVALALAVIAAATPAGADFFARLSELSAVGVSIKLSASSSEAVEQRLELQATGSGDDADEGDSAGQGFIGTYSEETAVRDLLILKDKLTERIDWIGEQLQLPTGNPAGTRSRIEALRWQGFLLPDEADLLKLLAGVTPKQAAQAHERQPAQLLALVRSTDKLLWRIRRIVFDRRVRQVFARYDDVWRIFDWEPQPGGRPWFMAHVDGRHTAEGRARTIIVAPRVAPTASGLESALKLLRDKRTEMPFGDEFVGVVVLRDRSPQLRHGRELSDDEAMTVSLTQLESIARDRRLPV